MKLTKIIVLALFMIAVFIILTKELHNISSYIGVREGITYVVLNGLGGVATAGFALLVLKTYGIRFDGFSSASIDMDCGWEQASKACIRSVIEIDPKSIVKRRSRDCKEITMRAHRKGVDSGVVIKFELCEVSATKTQVLLSVRPAYPIIFPEKGRARDNTQRLRASLKSVAERAST